MQTGLVISEEKDNCGFGLVATNNCVASHTVLSSALSALKRINHRGAINADGVTGDGCGVLFSLDKQFFINKFQLQNLVSVNQAIGLGMAFLDPNPQKLKYHKFTIQRIVESHNLKLLKWRKVKTNVSYLGLLAKKHLPYIIQFMVTAKVESTDFELQQSLYLVRKQISLTLADDPYFYICSLSSQVVCYKALVQPLYLSSFYIDLQDQELKTLFCLFHQRFSTNTNPQWKLAQPFRVLAHNGEINTIQGNRNWVLARNHLLRTKLIDQLSAEDILVNQSGSDSSSLDNMLELLIYGGLDLFRAIRLLLPPAWEHNVLMSNEIKALHQYHSLQMEPWEGPAGLVINHGHWVVCALDRNGLRPARWVLTKNNLIVVASEIGVLDIEPEAILDQGRVKPGGILAINWLDGSLWDEVMIDQKIVDQYPYYKWLEHHLYSLKLFGPMQAYSGLTDQEIRNYQKFFGFSRDDQFYFFEPLIDQGEEPIGAMGDDKPISRLSSRFGRNFYDSFRQQFAQVTNPPLDALRENMVMSLTTIIFGKRYSPFEHGEHHVKKWVIQSPIMTPYSLELLDHQLSTTNQKHCKKRILIKWDGILSLEKAIEKICLEVYQAVQSGVSLLILSDQHDESMMPIPTPLLVGAVHQFLIKKHIRLEVSLMIETAPAYNSHHFAVLIGLGADAIYPYLAYAMILQKSKQQSSSNYFLNKLELYHKAVNKGLKKILSKMGVNTIESYRGSQLFEVIGLDEEVINCCFPNIKHTLGGVKWVDLHDQIKNHCMELSLLSSSSVLMSEGLYRYKPDGEYHAFNPEVVLALRQASKTGSKKDYEQYAHLVNNRVVCTIRDLLTIKNNTEPLDLKDVEPIDSILKRFDSAAMSLGALSPEAHELLAMAMNQLGGRSNSGEGGEDCIRFNTHKNSKIKQIASGRFGVTAHYLANAEVLQIKMAQGAKPGEGGQLLGIKVNAMIAKLRCAKEGTTLISPPPHHDIYSIEDLAQLIYDLKQVNSKAIISVKLVSCSGVGTIASGVVKAGADMITISGYDGGTAASPLTSIYHAGTPWELGLAETHQTLITYGLRDQVILQVDGGLKTGLDVVKAALLGAQSFGFGTAPMIAMGCKYLRICHLNNCPTGIATQDQHLRAMHFQGAVDHVVHFFTQLATEVREYLAQLGYKNIEAIVGQTQLLSSINHKTNIDLNALLFKPQPVVAYKNKSKMHIKTSQVSSSCLSLHELLIQKCEGAIKNQTDIELQFRITNEDRSIGANIAGMIVHLYGKDALQYSVLNLTFRGYAGQSFGVWNVTGMLLTLVGSANDYVGKGMSGGRLVIYSSYQKQNILESCVLIGNTCAYGATGGALYVAGIAGERLAVRNSGALIITEGSGDHACEYMTEGVVVILGQVGINFGAGMTGGVAFVLHKANDFSKYCNLETIEVHKLTTLDMKPLNEKLKQYVEQLYSYTKSVIAQEILKDFESWLTDFYVIVPIDMDMSAILKTVGIDSEVMV